MTAEPVSVERSKYRRTPYLVVSTERAARKDVYGTIGDNVVRQAQLLRGDRDSDTVIVASHPIGSPAYLPFFPELARTGLHVIGCANRYTLGDSALQMENHLLDVGACVRDAKERLGYRKVVLAGWSGGGSPMMGYQAEAEKPSITQTAAGEPTPLAETTLTAADGVMLLAAPRSRHRLLTEFLDASVTDELVPERNRDAEFDLYDPANPNQPPYSADFLAAYRDRQRERNRRITAFAQEKLDEFRRNGRPHAEHAFVVHGTMADPRWLDPTIEPNGRRPRWSYLGDPEIANTSPGALMRFTTARSWLSQWGLDTAQVDAGDAAPRVSVPILMMCNGTDDAVPTSHQEQVFDAIGHQDKERIDLVDANHYFTGNDQRSHLSKAADHVHDWMQRHGFATS
ncbi:alpha/beta hydrolase [Mycobacterium paraintracellulare]|uniref:alpha/beta hydrolase n=1 Tax=Mycobacterium paraintracellulare TaxID=1138383 RepID=UPI00191544F9|nr:alpha/beta hydrolase [Mycobacterium paraintracellulare]BCP02750.1 alpha/beta hydrolase [Mycobacterium paraintracellulare]